MSLDPGALAVSQVVSIGSSSAVTYFVHTPLATTAFFVIAVGTVLIGLANSRLAVALAEGINERRLCKTVSDLTDQQDQAKVRAAAEMMAAAHAGSEWRRSTRAPPDRAAESETAPQPVSDVGLAS
jgi:hypothetical protein